MHHHDYFSNTVSIVVAEDFLSLEQIHLDGGSLEFSLGLHRSLPTLEVGSCKSLTLKKAPGLIEKLKVKTYYGHSLKYISFAKSACFEYS